MSTAQPFTLYLAGPMTGIAQFNFPAFESMSEELRHAGYGVISPHEEDHPEVQAAAWASPDGDISKLPQGKAGSDPGLTASKNIQDIARSHGVALLDDWHKSSGTVHEVATAHRFRIPVAPAALWLAADPTLIATQFGGML
jgi:hypothetical protein